MARSPLTARRKSSKTLPINSTRERPKPQWQSERSASPCAFSSARDTDMLVRKAGQSLGDRAGICSLGSSKIRASGGRMDGNNYPKLHNAMWPGLVGKGPGFRAADRPRHDARS